MTEPYAGTKTPSINQHIVFLQAPSFTNPVNINDPVALIYIYNSISYLCIGTITNMQGTRVNSITLSSVNSIGVNLLYGTCNVGTIPVAGSGTNVTSFNFNRTFKSQESGIFFATQGTSRNYIIFGQVQFDSDNSTPFKMISCKNVYDITSYKSLTNINIGDIDTVSYADNTATIQTNLILSQNGLETTIPSNIKLPIKAGSNITVDADETGKSIVISSPSQIKEFSSITDLYSFINQSNIEPLRLYVTLPEITGTYTTAQTDTTTNTTTVSSEDNYKYYEENSWTILITDYTTSSLSGISFTTGAFANTFNFVDNVLNTYLYSFTYGTNLVKSNLFYGYISLPSNITFKLYYTETT